MVTKKNTEVQEFRRKEEFWTWNSPEDRSDRKGEQGFLAPTELGFSGYLSGGVWIPVSKTFFPPELLHSFLLSTAFHPRPQRCNVLSADIIQTSI